MSDQTHSPELEYCEVCGGETHREGICEDSLYIETYAKVGVHKIEIGPLCEACYDELTEEAQNA